MGELGVLRFPVPVGEGILKIAAKQLSADREFRIATLFKQWGGGSQFWSALFRYTDHADIICDIDLNLCWQRFSVCKEAAHLLMDSEPKHFTTDCEALIQGLITQMPSNVEPDDIIDSEFMGVVVALETLMPWALRHELKALRESKTDLDVAKIIRVPEKYVSLMLGDHYSGLSERFNKELDGR